jgi:hypothetical protein
MEREIIDKAKGINLMSYIEQVLGLVPQRRASGGTFYFSPFRQEKEASLHVSLSKNGTWQWFDHGSANRDGGDAVKFVQKLRQCSFKEAVDELLQFDGSSFENEQIQPVKTSKTDTARNRLKKIFWVRKFYKRLPNDSERLIRKYFSERSLRFYPEMGCKVHVHFKDHLSYLAFPLPEIEKLRGLELREICSLEKELGLTEEKKNRKNYGTKTLWVFKRDTSRMLVAESILDALAGEVILNDYSISLAALNGVGQVSQLEPLIQSMKPQKVIFAPDRDMPGRETELIANEICETHKVQFEALETKEKDLFRELHSGKGVNNAYNGKTRTEYLKECS